jgi:hypothetical protein
MAECSIANLNTAISLLTQVALTKAAGGSHNPEYLNLLVTALLTRFGYTGQWDDVKSSCVIRVWTLTSGRYQDLSNILREVPECLDHYVSEFSLVLCTLCQFSLRNWNTTTWKQMTTL